MNKMTPARPFLMSLLLAGAFSTIGCGSAATKGDVESQAQALDDGVTPVAASAEPEREGRRHGRHGWFRKFDEDGDGRVAINDLPEGLRAHIAPADSNHDGFLTREELHAAKDAMHAKMKAEADINHDGTVSDEERKAARIRFTEQRLMKHDTNGDRALTPDEVSPKKWEHLKKADANGDGRITSEEVATAAANGTLGRFRGRHRHGDQSKTEAPPTVL